LWEESWVCQYLVRPMTDNISYTISQAAQFLQVSNAFVHRIIFTGKLRVTNHQISQESLNEYLTKHGEYLESVRSGECLRI